MGYITGTPFGIGSQVSNPQQHTAWGLSPYATQAIGPHPAMLVQPIVQSLQLVAQQLQQLQQIVQFVPQQIQQLQQLLLAQQATLGVPGSNLTGFTSLGLGAPGLPFQTQPPFFTGQPGQVM